MRCHGGPLYPTVSLSPVLILSRIWHVIDDCPSCPVCDLCHRKGHEPSCSQRKIFHLEIPGSASRKRGSSGPSQQPSKQQTVSFTSRYISPRPQSQAAEANGNNLVRVSASSVILNAKRDPGVPISSPQQSSFQLFVKRSAQLWTTG